MKAVERQRKLLGILYEKGHETMKNLAEILNVSERTIRRDVEFLSLSEPIYTRTGRFAGGVYIAKTNTRRTHRSKSEELLILEKVRVYLKEAKFLSEEELRLFDSILETYGWRSGISTKRIMKILK